MKLIQSIPNENVYFEETIVEYGMCDPATEGGIINVYDDVEYQEVIGFGGAFTESAAYNYSKLSEEAKKEFIKKYFDKKEGIGYNFGRTHINSCDFSLDIYSYVEAGDKTLETFNIERDKKYIIPLLKDALAYCEEEIILFASPWSAPAYMKTNENATGGGKIKEEYKRLWALYYTKYIKAYREEGINISAISVQNEPKAIQTWESCCYTAEEERDFLKDYLIPVLEEEGLNDIKIIIWDHNKDRVYDRAKTTLSDATVNEKVWAVGHHWYTGDHFDGLTLVHEQLGKMLLSTEICLGIEADAREVAERYAKEICEDFNHYTAGFCDWNVLLSDMGGPYHNRTAESLSVNGFVYESKDQGCYAPILFDREKSELIYTPIYYYIGHFSKYVCRGAKRIATTKYCGDIYACAFKNPDGTIVVIVLNDQDVEQMVNLRLDGKVTALTVKSHSIVTMLI